MIRPSLAEANVRQADRAPSEQRSQARQGQQPIEDLLAVGVQVDIGQQSTDEDKTDGGRRASGAVNVCKDLGCVALLRKRRERTRATVDTRDTNRHDGDGNDDVDEVVEAVEAGVLADEHKGRGGTVTAGAAEKTGVVGADEETYEHEAEDVETVGSCQHAKFHGRIIVSVVTLTA